MHRPVFGESTIRDNSVYRIDYEVGDDDVEAETQRLSLSPKASSVVPPPPTSRYGHHAFAETLPLSSRR